MASRVSNRRGTSQTRLREAGRRCLLCAASLFWLNAAGAQQTTPSNVTVTARPIHLNPEDLEQRRIGGLEWIAGLALSSPDPRFGGLSGLTLDAQGERLLSVSDKGHWLRAELSRDAAGRIAGLAAARMAPLLDPSGRPVRVRDYAHDAEAVERLADGGYAVSFERRHRVWRYPADPLGKTAASLRAEGFLKRLPLNGGIEAMVPLGPGRLLMVSEGAYDKNGDLAGWLTRPGGRDTLRYATTGPFKPTDFAWLPGGDLLALERRFHILTGVGARLQRIAREGIRPGARLAGHEVARFEAPLSVDNFEGLAVAVRDGETRIYLLSDDNFNALQRTLLLEFRLLE